MDNLVPASDERVRFSFRIDSITNRPEILSARSLDLTAVRDADLSFLHANRSLRVLYLTDVHALRGIEALSQVRELTLVHIPKVHSLQALAALRGLQVLTISTLPSWDASRKCLELESFDPLGDMHSLIALSLCGVKPIHGRLQPLHKLTGLRTISISHVYDLHLRDYADLAAHLPKTAGACLRPCFHMGIDAPCRKCGMQMVCLTGSKPRARRFLCVSCDRPRLMDHISAWNKAAGREFPYPASAQEAGPEAHLHYTGI